MLLLFSNFEERSIYGYGENPCMPGHTHTHTHTHTYNNYASAYIIYTYTHIFIVTKSHFHTHLHPHSHHYLLQQSLGIGNPSCIPYPHCTIGTHACTSNCTRRRAAVKLRAFNCSCWKLEKIRPVYFVMYYAFSGSYVNHVLSYECTDVCGSQAHLCAPLKCSNTTNKLRHN